MKRFFTAALALVLLASCAPKSTPVTLKLISYNIRQSGLAQKDGPDAWPLRKEATLKMIEQEAPALIGFQELLPNQQAYIREAFPQYGFVGVGRDDGKEEGECMGIMYLADAFELLDSGTFWLSETPEEVSMGWDAACRRTVTWVHLKELSAGKEFFYLNTHLDHIGELARQESIKLIVDRIGQLVPKGMPVILGGDLNSGTENPIFEPLFKAGMQLAREVSPETDNSGTFNGFGSAPSSIILDHLFIKGVKPVSYQVLKADYGAPFISDHYPVAFTFEI